MNLLFDEALKRLPEERGAYLKEACASEPALRAEVEELLAHDERARREDFLGRRHLALALAATGGEAETSSAVETAECRMRLRTVRPHARGGLGEVLLVHDEQLNRDVALKLIQMHHDKNPNSRRRFLVEAEVTAKLEHPGVVPVHGLAETSDGRPCYAMRFIQGESLQEAIRKFHEADKAGRSRNGASRTVVPKREFGNERVVGNERDEGVGNEGPGKGTGSFSGPAAGIAELAMEGPEEVPVSFSGPGQRSLALRQLLTQFVTVCKTIAYAHSRDIVHRDIKPANIMLGKYGETLVVDWGLAKRGTQKRGQAPFPASSAVDVEPVQQGPEKEPVPFSAEGQVVGTLQYMSPEQAAGRGEEVGPASDIYSLGATLYTLLTGTPPFPDARATNVFAVLEQVQQGRFRRPRQVQGKIPRALEAICLKAMALRAEDRYTSAQALADDVEHWLADEPVTAYREPRRTRVARWLRRHKTLGSSLAVLAGTGLVALLISTGVLARSKARAERAEAQAVEAAESATIAQQRAEKVLEYFVATFRRADPNRDGRKVTVVEVLKRSAEQLPTEEGLDGATRGALLNAIGHTYLGLGLPAEAVDVLEQARAVRRDQLGPEHPDTLISMNNLAGAYKNAGRLSDAVQLLEETVKLQMAKLGAQHVDTLTSMNNLAGAYKDAGRLSDALPLYEQTLKLRKAMLGAQHADALQSMNNLAAAYHFAGRVSDALLLCEETLKLRKAKLGPQHPGTLNSMDNLASAYRSAGRLSDALPLYEEALKLRKAKLGPEHPATLISMNNLASAYQSTGRLSDGVQLFEETLKVQKANLGRQHPATLTSMNNLASAYKSAGRLSDALPLCEETLKLCKAKLGLEHPGTLNSMDNLASAYRSAGRVSDALPLYEETLKVRKATLGPEHPATLTSMNNLALAYQSAGRLSDALPLCEETLKLRKAKLGPEHPGTLNSMNSVASAYQSAGRLSDALPLYEETLKLRKAKLGPEHPDTLTSMNNLASAYKDAGRLSDALPLVRDVLDKYRKQRPEQPLRVARTLAELGKCLFDLDQGAEAEPFVRESVAVREKHLQAGDWRVAESRSLLGACLTKQQQFTQAEQLLLESYEVLTKSKNAPPRQLHDTLEWLVELYTAWGHADKAAQWHEEWEARKASR